MPAERRSAWLFGAVICVIIQSVCSEPTFDCPRLIPDGDHIGKIIGIIDKDDFLSPNYLFQPVGEQTGCIQFHGMDNSIRFKLILNAYLLGTVVKVKVKGNHEIASIAFGS